MQCMIDVFREESKKQRGVQHHLAWIYKNENEKVLFAAYDHGCYEIRFDGNPKKLTQLGKVDFTQCACSQNGSFVIFSQRDCTVLIWDVKNDKTKTIDYPTQLKGRDNEGREFLHISNDAKQIIIMSSENVAFLCDSSVNVQTKEWIPIPQHFTSDSNITATTVQFDSNLSRGNTCCITFASVQNQSTTTFNKYDFSKTNNTINIPVIIEKDCKPPNGSNIHTCVEMKNVYIQLSSKTLEIETKIIREWIVLPSGIMVDPINILSSWDEQSNMSCIVVNSKSHSLICFYIAKKQSCFLVDYGSVCLRELKTTHPIQRVDWIHGGVACALIDSQGRLSLISRLGNLIWLTDNKSTFKSHFYCYKQNPSITSTQTIHMVTHQNKYEIAVCDDADHYILSLPSMTIYDVLKRYLAQPNYDPNYMDIWSCLCSCIDLNLFVPQISTLLLNLSKRTIQNILKNQNNNNLNIANNDTIYTNYKTFINNTHMWSHQPNHMITSPMITFISEQICHNMITKNLEKKNIYGKIQIIISIQRELEKITKNVQLYNCWLYMAKLILLENQIVDADQLNNEQKIQIMYLDYIIKKIKHLSMYHPNQDPESILTIEENVIMNRITSTKHLKKLISNSPHLQKSLSIKLFIIHLMKCSIHSIFNHVQSMTPFDLLNAGLGEIGIGCIPIDSIPHLNLINILYCTINHKPCWVHSQRGIIFPNVLNSHHQNVDVVISNEELPNYIPIDVGLLSEYVESSLSNESKSVLIRLLLGVAKVEQAIQFCLKDTSQRFRLPNIFLSITKKSHLKQNVMYDKNTSQVDIGAFQVVDANLVESMYTDAVKNALVNDPSDVDNLLQSAEMFVPSGAHRMRILATNALLQNVKRKLSESNPFDRYQIDGSVLIDRIKRIVLRSSTVGDVMEHCIAALVDVISIMVRCNLSDILHEYEKCYRDEIVNKNQTNQIAHAYVEDFHVLCRYMWYIHQVLCMHDMMSSIDPFQSVYKPTSNQPPSPTREEKLLIISRHSLELLSYFDLHNKVLLQGSLLTVLGLLRNPSNVATILQQIDESDIIVSLRRRLDQLKEKSDKYTPVIKQEPFGKPYWNFIHSTIDSLMKEPLRSALLKDHISSADKYQLVAKSVRRMSLKKRPILITPSTPLTPGADHHNHHHSSSIKKSFKIPSIRNLIKKKTSNHHPNHVTKKVNLESSTVLENEDDQQQYGGRERAPSDLMNISVHHHDDDIMVDVGIESEQLQQQKKQQQVNKSKRSRLQTIVREVFQMNAPSSTFNQKQISKSNQKSNQMSSIPPPQQHQLQKSSSLSPSHNNRRSQSLNEVTTFNLKLQNEKLKVNQI
ncbi:hypothetical protein AKO1_015722 [Acrasis kona]|uniref:Uncharacterized protein n=1 Tax=Acrasis kona TaxID=1008807 RepID=A0AAW2ZGS8_9EUKA